MRNLRYSSVMFLAVMVCLTGLGCHGGFQELASCGCAEEPCDLSSCGCAEEPCNLPSCGCAEEPCDTKGCGNCIGCKKQTCSWWKKLAGCLQLCDCAGCGGELYWSEWHNDPPGCEPCDSCGNWIGTPGMYRAPYRTLPNLATESRIAPMNVHATEFATPEEYFEQDNHTPESEYEQIPEEALKLSLEQETIFR
ncbi:MAG: hypothetical protein ABGX16_10720 [Pirellulales bacterium]